MFLNVNKYKYKDLSPTSILHDNRVGGNFIGGHPDGIKAWYSAYYGVMEQFVKVGSCVCKIVQKWHYISEDAFVLGLDHHTFYGLQHPGPGLGCTKPGHLSMLMNTFLWQEGSFIGKDQHMMATACAQHGPDLCFLVDPKHPTKKLDRVSKWCPSRPWLTLSFIPCLFVTLCICDCSCTGKDSPCLLTNGLPS